MVKIETPHGPARAHLQAVDKPRGALVLGHGAGGGVQAPDLVAATKAANEESFSVALVEQPYRVAGRRSPAPAKQLDAAWTVDETGGVAVLCLAFPLEPPRRTGKPRQSRLAELEAVDVPVLVVQGSRDPFGLPPPGRSREVVTVPG